ncbi:hypothetical protein M3J09_010329 [Ascochyta lentis]
MGTLQFHHMEYVRLTMDERGYQESCPVIRVFSLSVTAPTLDLLKPLSQVLSNH